MIPRTAALTLQRLAKGFSLIALTGPRQSGKTTLAKGVFADKAYVSRNYSALLLRTDSIQSKLG
jgi:predicted AAA+ superfamily ATPase